MDILDFVNEELVPEEVLNAANEALAKIVPNKSKSLYEKEYMLFCQWRNKKQVKGVNEKIIMAYISEKSKNVKSSSLWSYYSQLKKMLSVKENVDISKFHQVKAFLKNQSVGYRPKKSNVFSREDVEKFLDTAPDDKYLLLKVALIMGVSGGCRICELVAMSTNNVDDRGSVLVVKIPDTKTYKERIFTVVNGSNNINAIDVFQKYKKLRPQNVPHTRLFLNYKNEKCTVQPVGFNTFSKMPQKIAEFLGLENAGDYTGHSFRRSSASLLAEAGADLSILKRHGGWRSDSVAEGYVEQSIRNKIEISRKILGNEVAVGAPEKAGTVANNKYNISENTLQISNLNNEPIAIGTNIDSNNGPIHSNVVSNVSEQLTIPLNNEMKLQFNNLNNCNFYFDYKK